MKVLSLFDGMGCGALALQTAGVEIESYDAFEIDKYAVQTSSHNFPFIQHHGDVFNADFTQFEGVDLVCGGSPCTYWSIAQKNNRETEASGMGWELFQQYVRAIKEAKPKFFIYENNKSMSKAIRQSIDEAFGFEAVLINSALVSAQNRQRLYWVGRRNEDGTYSKVNVEQPEDRGIVLRDILESGTAWREKSYCLDANYYKASNGTKPCGKSQSSQRMCVAEPINTTDDGKSQTLKAQYQKNNVSNFCCYTSTYGATGVAEPVRIPPYGAEDKARPINALYPNNCGGFEHRMFSEKPNKQQVDMIAEPVRIPEYGVDDKSRPVITAYSKRGTCENQVISNCFPENPNKQLSDYVAEPIRIGDIGSNSQAHRVYSCDGKSVTLSANGGGQGGKTGLYATPCYELSEEYYKGGADSSLIGMTANGEGKYRNGSQPSQQYRVYSCEGKSQVVNTLANENYVTPMRVAEATKQGYVDIEPGDCVDLSFPSSKTRRGRSMKEKSNCLMANSSELYQYCGTINKPIYEVKDGFITIKGKQYPIKLKDGYYIIRKLTVTECKRLQTVPEWYVFPVSDTQAYKMLGNGWTIEVIAHLIKACLTDKGDVQLKLYEQMRLF